MCIYLHLVYQFQIINGWVFFTLVYNKRPARFLYLELSEVIWRFLSTTFYPVWRATVVIMSFSADAHRDVVMKHEKYDRCTSYANGWKPKKNRASSQILILEWFDVLSGVIWSTIIFLKTRDIEIFIPINIKVLNVLNAVLTTPL